VAGVRASHATPGLQSYLTQLRHSARRRGGGAQLGIERPAQTALLGVRHERDEPCVFTHEIKSDMIRPHSGCAPHAGGGEALMTYRSSFPKVTARRARW